MLENLRKRDKLTKKICDFVVFCYFKIRGIVCFTYVRDILSLYEKDLFKFDKTEKSLVVYNSFSADFSGRIKKFKMSSLSRNARSSNMLDTVLLLKESSLVLVAFNVTDPSINLFSSKDMSKFKLFCSDTGLLVTKMFSGKKFVENKIYEKLLSNKLDLNLGYLMENAVAQTLIANGNDLYYCLFQNKESHHSYEIDFLLTRASKVIPVEVKSSNYKSHRSLDIFGYVKTND